MLTWVEQGIETAIHWIVEYVKSDSALETSHLEVLFKSVDGLLAGTKWSGDAAQELHSFLTNRLRASEA